MSDKRNPRCAAEANVMRAERDRKVTCGECKWWEQYSVRHGFGDCRRPFGMVHINGGNTLPVQNEWGMHRDDWCEYGERKGQA